MGRLTLAEADRTAVQVLIKRLLRDWEVWVILSCLVALSVALSAFVTRSYTLGRIEQQIIHIRQSVDRIEARK